MSQDPNTIVLKNTRLSYPFLYVPRKSEDNPNAPAKWSASGLIPKTDKETIKLILDTIKRVAASVPAWKGKTIMCDKEVLVEGGEEEVELKGICLRDGKEKKGTVGYGPDVMFLSAARSTVDSKGQAISPPQVIDTNRVPISAESGKVYGGCYGHLSVRIWAQNNKFGKRINAELRAFMFTKDGEPFGNGPVDASRDFAGLSESEFDSAAPEQEEAPKKTKSRFDVEDDAADLPPPVRKKLAMPE